MVDTRPSLRPRHDLSSLDSCFEAAAAGSKSAFRHAVETVSPVLEAYFVKRVFDIDTAQDLAQIVLERVYYGLEDYRPMGKAKGWLFMTAHNTYANYVRERKRRPEVVSLGIHLDPKNGRLPGSGSLITDDAESPDAIMIRAEENAQVRNAVQNIDPLYQQVIQWKIVDELSDPEISAKLGKTLGAAKALYRRARAAVAKELSSQADHNHDTANQRPPKTKRSRPSSPPPTPTPTSIPRKHFGNLEQLRLLPNANSLPFTPRHWDIMQLAAGGRNITQIAESLELPKQTALNAIYGCLKTGSPSEIGIMGIFEQVGGRRPSTKTWREPLRQFLHQAGKLPQD
jgi:RNA polymerase sigma-70 factor (ECF subfamily)